MKQTIRKVGIIYVDDTNLLARLEEDEDRESIGHKGQAAVLQWGRSLMATGGALSPAKYFWTVLYMTCNTQGKWEYSEAWPPPPAMPPKVGMNDKLDDLPTCILDDEDPDHGMETLPPLAVPLANADAAAIKYLQSWWVVVGLSN